MATIRALGGLRGIRQQYPFVCFTATWEALLALHRNNIRPAADFFKTQLLGHPQRGGVALARTPHRQSPRLLNLRDDESGTSRRQPPAQPRSHRGDTEIGVPHRLCRSTGQGHQTAIHHRTGSKALIKKSPKRPEPHGRFLDLQRCRGQQTQVIPSEQTDCRVGERGSGSAQGVINVAVVANRSPLLSLYERPELTCDLGIRVDAGPAGKVTKHSENRLGIRPERRRFLRQIDSAG